MRRPLKVAAVALVTVLLSVGATSTAGAAPIRVLGNTGCCASIF